MATSQRELILEYFRAHPHRDIPHTESVPWLEAEWLARTGKRFADPDRGIRKLHEEGYLQKINKSIYRYDPEQVELRALEDFSAALRAQILERDGYRCVICGLGQENGVELHVDHIKPKDKGGRATLENGQTLCAAHNFRKKNYSQTESGKRMFIRLLDAAQSTGDEEMVAFCREILAVYEKHNINGHIEWQDI